MKNKIYKSILTAMTCFAFAACDDNIDPLVEELQLSRALTPVELKAFVRNNTTIELQWDLRKGVEKYIVEFSEDSLQFNSIIFTDQVTADELPYRHTFESETRYSARVKSAGVEGKEDSNWAAITIATASENIFMPVQEVDILATEVVLNWTANSEVTHFVITPGSIVRQITADEKSAGTATVTGLTGETDYAVQLKNNTKNRGLVKFTTAVDIGDATAVNPGDNLATIIAAAQPGDVLALFPGDYTVNTGATIIIDKALSLKGVRSFDKPKLHVQFSLTGAGNMEFRDLDLDGDGTLNDVFRYNAASVVYGDLTLKGCNIHDFTRSLVAANLSTTKVPSVLIDNCVVTDVVSSGGDFIDFRNTYVGNLTVSNSTFDNCAPARDFIRVDNVAPANGYSGTGLTSTVLVDHCTLYGVSNNMTSTRRVTYVRFATNVVTVKNTIIASSTGFFTNQATTTQPVCSNNNYFNAQRFYDAAFEAPAIANLKVDISGTHTTLDPGFTDATNGNFTVSNQTIKDNNTGDPRWLQ